MPQGPFGGPRITNLLPFSSDEIDVEFIEDIDDNPLIPLELEGLINDLGIEPDRVTKIRREVIVKQSTDGGDLEILDKIRQEVAELGKRTASVLYYTVDNDIGYIHKSSVDRRMRRRGIASELRKTVLNDMEERGVRKAYSIPVTDAGEGLVKSQGFTKDREMNGVFSKELV